MGNLCLMKSGADSVSKSAKIDFHKIRSTYLMGTCFNLWCQADTCIENFGLEKGVSN